MARQLSLLEAPPTWPLSRATRETGRRGVAEARKALAEAVARAKQAEDAQQPHRGRRTTKGGDRTPQRLHRAA